MPEHRVRPKLVLRTRLMAARLAGDRDGSARHGDTDSPSALIDKLAAPRMGHCCSTNPAAAATAARRCATRAAISASASATCTWARSPACPFYISGPQFEYWQHTHLIIDAVPGRGSGFSLEAPEGMRFLTRSRVFTDAENDELERMGAPPRGPEAMAPCIY